MASTTKTCINLFTRLSRSHPLSMTLEKLHGKMLSAWKGVLHPSMAPAFPASQARQVGRVSASFLSQKPNLYQSNAIASLSWSSLTVF